MAYRAPRYGDPSMTRYSSSGSRFSSAAPFPSLARPTVSGPAAIGQTFSTRRTPAPAPAPVRAPSQQTTAASTIDQLKAALGANKTAAPSTANISYDYTTDPIMQQIAALGTQSRQ